MVTLELLAYYRTAAVSLIFDIVFLGEIPLCEHYLQGAPRLTLFDLYLPVNAGIPFRVKRSCFRIPRSPRDLCCILCYGWSQVKYDGVCAAVCNKVGTFLTNNIISWSPAIDDTAAAKC